MADVHGKLVGKYTSHMDPMEYEVVYWVLLGCGRMVPSLLEDELVKKNVVED